ncbi:ABC transporter permease subunit [Sinorhizobium meliloti]|uniref:ABC transporter permease subunit n=1 Tax=Rhizobium meliloti TaxID=382 RepID=UPI001EEA33B5|nr:ABC transporter permease subunit [Sinorhizobium meliloti]
MAVSLVIATFFGLAAGSSSKPLRWLIGSYVWLFRGAPALLILLFIWNGLPQISAVFRGNWFTPFVAALLAFTLFQVAYLTEILRSAFAAVGRGQQVRRRWAYIPGRHSFSSPCRRRSGLPCRHSLTSSSLC